MVDVHFVSIPPGWWEKAQVVMFRDDFWPRDWTLGEDKALVSARFQRGSHWREIARRLDRSVESCRKRWTRLRRRAQDFGIDIQSLIRRRDQIKVTPRMDAYAQHVTKTMAAKDAKEWFGDS